eukprot:TRINITY_DN14142_c0_g1_i5.p1 TRINITY_DN14142_c0_g1~~TRINITY_DN14142_c0_g1_i5.p1  ORF type:complete len:291 (-),score=64.83 TRINITY_DN14142_c0_g1_i5:205-1077(-)
MFLFFFFFQAEDGIRDAQESRGLGDVYKRQVKQQVLSQVLGAGLEEMWLEMCLHCDVFYDLLLHALSVRHGRMIARYDIVDCSGMGITNVGLGVMSMIKKVGLSSEHYPEMILRTAVTNFGDGMLKLMNWGKSFLPKQTASKFQPYGVDYALPGISPHLISHRHNGCCTCDACTNTLDRHWKTVNVLPGHVVEKRRRVDLRRGDVSFALQVKSKIPVEAKFIDGETRDETTVLPKGLVADDEMGVQIKVGGGGEIILVFDNSNSSWFSDNVKYRLFPSYPHQRGWAGNYT